MPLIFRLSGLIGVVLGYFIFIPTGPLLYSSPTLPISNVSYHDRTLVSGQLIDCPMTHSTSTSLTIPISVRNAHIAESQAELCAANVATYLSLSPSAASKGMLKYPQGIFGVKEVPLLACVSLGKSDSHITVRMQAGTIHEINSSFELMLIIV